MNLLISVVIYEWDARTLEPTLESLSDSLDSASESGELQSATLWLSYNGERAVDETEADRLVRASFRWPAHLLCRQPNLGYGGTNNLILHERIFSGSSVLPDDTAILVLNPDVQAETDAIARALRRLRQDPRCGLVCPRILDWSGEVDTSGHKRYPSLAVLAARLFYPLMKLRALRLLNERYEYRDLPVDRMLGDVVLCSGCFMLARYQYWKDLGGFDGDFFMYFEDFDLAARGREHGWHHVYDPSVRIRHAGGGAGQKSWQHRFWFARSAWKFFRRHGWRVWQV